MQGVGEYETITPHPTNSDIAVIAFKDRPTAEAFFFSTREIPELGKTKFEWFNAPLPAANGHGDDHVNGAGEGDKDGDVGMKDASGGTEAGGRVHGDDDYDVAEEDERWG